MGAGDTRVFASDYTRGCHPAVLEALVATNLEVCEGYGTDAHCERARELIRAACEAPQAAVHFIAGGTQTNATVIAALLHVAEGVVAPSSGHIATHEAGAIEAGGHKVITLPAKAGKLEAETLSAFLEAYVADENRDHEVAPGMVYVSQPTEYGTLYRTSELEAIASVAHDHGLLLYVDGARLAYALATPTSDLTLPALARMSDVFYVGGTKCGTLLGEAVVMADPTLCPRFFTISKACGALLAKGRVLGVQFEALFEDGLYERIGAGAIAAADRVRAAFAEAGIPQAIESPTNQVFPVLTDEQAKRLCEKVSLGFWERLDEGHVVMRLATSWAVSEQEVDAAVAAILDMR